MSHSIIFSRVFKQYFPLNRYRHFQNHKSVHEDSPERRNDSLRERYILYICHSAMFKWNCVWLHSCLCVEHRRLILSSVIFVPDTFFHSSKHFCLDRLSACYPFFFFLSSLLPRVSANLYDNQYRFAQTSTVLNKHARTLVPTLWLDGRALYRSNSAKCDFISTLDDKLKWRHSHHLHDNQQLSIMPMLVFDADSNPFSFF